MLLQNIATHISEITRERKSFLCSKNIEDSSIIVGDSRAKNG